ncbi:transmembrane protein 88B isoform X2 [Camelus dromedarius]|uniref:transmembrane protein 88B isoform X2 n=1 Tax=Camelus dromedarius TaxID=9838 RepID=UPI00311A1725
MSGQEREMEEDEGEGTSDTALMLPRRPPDCQAAALRSPRWGGLAAQGLGILLLPGRALAGLLLHLLLPAAVFLLVLLPAAAIVFLGFLCHSRSAGLQRVPEVVRFAWETPRCMFPKFHRRPENQACRAQPENGISIYTPHVPSAESVMWLDQHGDDG